MLPAALTLQNYRSFRGPQRVELRPITLVYGVNNAGKSSLLRVLPLIGASVEPEISGPLQLDCPAMQGASFEDIRWCGELGDDVEVDDAHQALRIVLHWPEGEPRALDYVFDRIESPGAPLLRRLRVKTLGVEGEGGWTLARRQLLRSEADAAALTYEIQRPSVAATEALSLEFEGLLPYAGSEEPAWLVSARARVANLRGQIQWLRAKRQPPARFSIISSNPRHRLQDDGGDAAQLLATRPGLLARVSSWYENMVQRRLVLREVPPAAFRTQLQHLKTGQAVDLLDSGEGMNQVLAVLCALETARARSRAERPPAPQILALEEPESHLHPQLQRGLVDRLVEIAAEEDAPRVILETHSEHILLGVQLAIARGTLDPRDVAIYWIRQHDDGRSVADLSTFDELAFPQGAWPPSVFGEDTELAREIVRARKERGR